MRVRARARGRVRVRVRVRARVWVVIAHLQEGGGLAIDGGLHPLLLVLVAAEAHLHPLVVAVVVAAVVVLVDRAAAPRGGATHGLDRRPRHGRVGGPA